MPKAYETSKVNGWIFPSMCSMALTRYKKPEPSPVPRELLREVGLEPGDRVHWALNPDMPGTILLVPSRMIARTMPAALEALRQTAR